ncbi:MAG TPA: MFS transporter [Micromonosporaceae bacterium]
MNAIADLEPGDTLEPPVPTDTAAAEIATRPHLLRRANFRRYWTGHAISLFGDQVSTLAIPLLAVLTSKANAAQMGFLTAAGLIPYLLFSLVAGAWADRRSDKRRIMIAADLGRMAVLVAVPVLYLTGGLTLPILYGVAFAVGTLSVAFEVCDNTLFVSLVGKEDYVAANTLLNGARGMTLVAGPSAAGLLVQLLNAPLAVLADALSYLCSALNLSRIKAIEPPPATGTNWGIAEGMKFMTRNPVMRSMLAATTTLNLFNYIFSALFVLYATRSLGVRPGTLGLVLGVGAVGALIGAVITRPLVRKLGIGPAYVLSQVLFPAPFVLVPLAHGGTIPVLAMLFGAEFLAGAGVMLLDITAGSLMTAVIPDALRARAAGAQRTVNYGIRPIGALIGGVLGTTIGIHAAIWVGAVGGMLGVLWLIGSPIPRMRDMPEPA